MTVVKTRHGDATLRRLRALLTKRAFGRKSLGALAVSLALAGGGSMMVSANTGADLGTNTSAPTHISLVGQDVTLFGSVASLGTGSFMLDTGRRVDWTVTSTTSTVVYGELASATSASPAPSALSGVSQGQNVVVEGTVTTTRTVAATDVIVMPRSLPNAAVDARAIFGNVSALATGGFTLVTTMDHVAWTVDTTASTVYIATSGATSDASTLTTISAHLAVMGIVTAHDTIGATAVFAIASHPGAQPPPSPTITSTATFHPLPTSHTLPSSAGAFTHHAGGFPWAAGRFNHW